ncbi:MAG: Ig-like domain-containing protein [Pseudomonadota bacterium]|nr:Ig-like domain-containing protein [Pseudomonadota bacterium]
MLLPLLLLGCEPDDPKESVPEDTGYVFVDTAEADDTAPPDTSVDTAETADTSIDSGDDTAVDTSQDTAVVPTWLTLEVWPASLVVHPGATWTLRVVGTDPDGARGDLPGDLWGEKTLPAFTVDDSAIASVDAAGLVTALAEGTTNVRVFIGGLEATCAIVVRADGVATITVLDASTGLPIAGANVAVPFTAPVETDAAGVALLPVADGGPLTFSAWVDDTYDAVTVVGVAARELTVSVRLKDTVANDATLTGPVDFAGVDDGGWSDVVVGFAAASIQGSLASTRLEDLFADDRAITVFGVDADAPANLFVETAAETYVAAAFDGPVAVWGLGGPIAITDATESLSGTGDALQLLADNLGSMSWGQVAGLTATSGGETTAGLAPASRFDDVATVSLPPLSLGFTGTEEYFLLVTEERVAEGFVVTGLGTGGPAASSDIPMVLAGTVADSLGTTVLAYAQVGGLGSGGATSAAIATENSEGNLIAPLLQDIPTVDSWDPAARAFGYTVDTDAQLVRIRLRDERNRVHDIFAPSSWSGTIPNCVSSFRLPSASIEVLALETTGGSYEAWLSAGDLEVDDKPTVTAARTTQE